MATEHESTTGTSYSGGAGADRRLERLLELWDRLDEEGGTPNTLGMTFLVQGTVYSGLLIPGRVWASTMSSLLHSSGDNSQVSALGVFFDEIKDSFESAGPSAETTEYVHLANAVVGIPSEGRTTGLLMRIRTADVSGWSVGTAGPLAPFDPKRVLQAPVPPSSDG